MTGQFLLFLLTLELFSCSKNSQEIESPLLNTKKVGLILGLAAGDHSFNDIQYNGLVRTGNELGIEVAYRVTEKPTPQEINALTDDLVEEGCGLIFGGGVIIDQAFPDAALKHTETRFVYMDGVLPDRENLLSVTFNQYQGSYLAGALAAKMSKTQSLIFLGGVDLPVIEEFEKGFVDGARSVNPNIRIVSSYLSKKPDFSGFENPQLAYDLTLAGFQQGADLAYSAAGASGMGMIQAAKETGNWVIGVDADQDSLAPGTILTSMMKRLDLVIFEETENWLRGDPLVLREKKLGISEKGVSLSPMTYTRAMIGTETLEFLRKLEIEMSKIGLGP